MRITLAAVAAALVLPATAAGVAPPVVEDPNGGTPWSCAWNPYVRIACNGGACWWVGEFQWRDHFGNFNGERCA